MPTSGTATTSIVIFICSVMNSGSYPLQKSIAMVATAPKSPTTTAMMMIQYLAERLLPSINPTPMAAIATIGQKIHRTALRPITR